MYKTAESVTVGHPDKVCDQISDAVLDACLAQDPFTRAAIEVLGGHGMITVCGELTTRAQINIRKIAEQVYKDCGYTESVGIIVNVVEQSPQISHGVNQDGAGDQGIMVGFATDETAELVPLEVLLSRKLTKAMGKRDGKAQVTVNEGKVVNILTSICLDESTPAEKARSKKDNAALEKAVLSLSKYLPKDMTGKNAVKNIRDIWLRNPNGAWTIGGFHADTGLTGRKLAVDNYGPTIPLGGGCFSGKDSTKVDRSAAYIARRIAVDYLRARKAHEVYVHIAYAIGLPDPLMAVATVDGVQEQIKIVRRKDSVKGSASFAAINTPEKGYDLRPSAIIDFLELRKPIFRKTAEYGHFGNGFVWER